MEKPSKRKAEAISPTREAHGQATSTPNDRKRHATMNSGKQPKLEGDVIKHVTD
jgi:hypothetical protein